MSTPTTITTLAKESTKVTVCIVSDANNVTRRELLAQLFSNALFTVIDQTGDIPPLPRESRESREVRVIQHALAASAELDPYAVTLVVKETSVSMASPSLIAKVVRDCLASAEWDLCYLCKWGDRCHLYDAIPHIGTEFPIPPATLPAAGRARPSVYSPYAIMRTRAPDGLQAVMYRPICRDVILGRRNMAEDVKLSSTGSLPDRLRKEIYEGRLRAHCIVPNLLNYDTVLNALTNDDYVKLNECQPIEINKARPPSNSHSAVWLLLCVLLIIMILVWLSLRALSRPKSKPS